MKLDRLFIALAGAVSLAGCVSADMVSPPNSASPYAPLNEGARSGVIKYLNAGADIVREQRREDAYKQMHQACNGRYRIDAEGPNPEGGTVINSGASAFIVPSNYWYIQFSCVVQDN
jgi:hypothetical protein